MRMEKPRFTRFSKVSYDIRPKPREPQPVPQEFITLKYWPRSE